MGKNEQKYNWIKCEDLGSLPLQWNVGKDYFLCFVYLYVSQKPLCVLLYCLSLEQGQGLFITLKLFQQSRGWNCFTFLETFFNHETVREDIEVSVAVNIK